MKYDVRNRNHAVLMSPDVPFKHSLVCSRNKIDSLVESSTQQPEVHSDGKNAADTVLIRDSRRATAAS